MAWLRLTSKLFPPIWPYIQVMASIVIRRSAKKKIACVNALRAGRGFVASFPAQLSPETHRRSRWLFCILSSRRRRGQKSICVLLLRGGSTSIQPVWRPQVGAFARAARQTLPNSRAQRPRVRSRPQNSQHGRRSVGRSPGVGFLPRQSFAAAGTVRKS